VLALTAPPWLEHEWTHSAAYNFASSEWGGLVFHAVEFAFAVLIIRALFKPLMRRIHHHLECDHPGCEHWGRPVHGTSHRACHEHHPHQPWETTAEDMRKHAIRGHVIPLSPQAGTLDGEHDDGGTP
jgi:hypothetical protein